MSQLRVLILGEKEEHHVGAHFLEACEDLGIKAGIIGQASASLHPLIDKLYYHFLGRRYPMMWRYEKKVLEKAASGFDLVLAIGRVPLRSLAIRRIREKNIRVANFMTDDPLNPLYRSGWLLKAVQGYDSVFTPRRSNLEQLREMGVAAEYLPFAYSESKHFSKSPTESANTAADILFVGSADKDREGTIGALLGKGLRICAFGGDWGRYISHPDFAHAVGTQAELRQASIDTKVSLILTRRANRDGHVMRSYEAAASGACLLVEDTDEHRDIYGPESVVFFGDNEDMIRKAVLLCNDANRRAFLRLAAQNAVVGGENTYRFRLRSIIRNTMKVNP